MIPYVASVRASCEIRASGEELALLNDASVRSTVEVQPGPCSIGLTVLGADIGLPVLNTTPLGRDAFYLPGVATLTLGLVDVSVDLQTSLTGTLDVLEPEAADLRPPNATWASWGAARVVVDAIDGEGSVLETSLETTFHYAMSLGLTVYALNVPAYHADLAQIGVFRGSHPLSTPLSVDLRPPTLVLLPPEALASDRATLRWTGTVPEDADHLELWVSGDGPLVTYPIDDPSTRTLEIPLRPSSSYESWVVTVDRAGQSSESARLSFVTPAGPDGTPLEPSGIPSLPWALLAVGIVLAVVVVAGLRARKAT